MISVAVCCREKRLEDTIKAIDKKNSDIHLISCSDNPHTITHTLVSLHPDVLIFEDMGSENQLAMIETLRRYSVETEILVVNSDKTVNRLIQLFHAGANDVLVKHWSEVQLLHAIRRLGARVADSTRLHAFGRERRERKLLMHQLYSSCFDDVLGKNRIADLDALNQRFSASLQDTWYCGISFFFDLINQGNPIPFEQWLLYLSDYFALCDDYFRKACIDTIQWQGGNRISVLLNTPKPILNMRYHCEQINREAEKRFEWYRQTVAVTAGIGIAREGYEYAAKTLQTARIACLNRLVRSKGEIISFDRELEPYISATGAITEQQAHQLRCYIEQRKLQECIRYVRDAVGANRDELFILRCRAIALFFADCFQKEQDVQPISKSQQQVFRMKWPRPIEQVATVEMVLDELIHWITESFAALPGVEDKIIDESIVKARQYIAQNYTQTVRLEEVAEYCGLTPAYLSAKFHRLTGKTFVDYLTQLRLERAIDILVTTDEKVGAVAIQAGFQDTRHFSRLFRKQYGVLPTEFRKRIRHRG